MMPHTRSGGGYRKLMPQIFLASRSPRRRELLAQIGVLYRLLDVDVDESIMPGETPDAYVVRLALAKAVAGANQRPGGYSMPVLAADTAVIAGEVILGKPSDRYQALSMLRTLSGRTHRVLTAVALVGERIESRLSCSQVRFRHIDDEEAADYWASGEPLDKAGGYAIQGLGALFIEHLQGSYSGVMGLPLFETAELLENAGIRILKNRLRVEVESYE